MVWLTKLKEYPVIYFLFCPLPFGYALVLLTNKEKEGLKF